MINIFYALHDWDVNLKSRGAFPIQENELEKYNQQGYGIFWTPNIFENARKKENLYQFLYWLADIDEGAKDEQLKKIDDLPIQPSMLVETPRGFHCYWQANGKISLENHKAIQIGIINFLKADKACKDITRLLRYPNYLHWKNKEKPFLVKIYKNNNNVYTEKQMMLAFSKRENNIKKTKTFNNYSDDLSILLDESRWDKIFNLNNISQGNRNCEFARIRLWLKDKGVNAYEIYEMIKKMNLKIYSPLPDNEIQQICRIKL